MGRNFPLYTLYRILTVEGICHGLYLWWLVTARHQSPMQVATYAAMADVLVAILEIPTGRFADRWGRRPSMALGSILQWAGLWSLWRGPVLAGLLLVAAGDAFRSGAQEALLYESSPEAFNERIAWTQTVLLLALSALTATGGWLAVHWSGSLAWQVELTLTGLGLITVIAMGEPPRHVPEEPLPVKVPWPPILLGAACCATAALAEFMVPLQYRNPADIAAWIAVYPLAEAAGGWLAQYLHNPRWLWGLAAVGALCLLHPLLYLGAFAAAGAAIVLRMQAVFHAAGDDQRATAGSIGGVCDLTFRIALLMLAARFFIHGIA